MYSSTVCAIFDMHEEIHIHEEQAVDIPRDQSVLFMSSRRCSRATSIARLLMFINSSNNVGLEALLGSFIKSI